MKMVDTNLVELVANAIKAESAGGTPFEVFERMAKRAIQAMGNHIHEVQMKSWGEGYGKGLEAGERHD